MQVTTRDVNIKIVNLRCYEVIHTVFIGLGVSVAQEFQMLKKTGCYVKEFTLGRMGECRRYTVNFLIFYSGMVIFD